MKIFLWSLLTLASLAHAKPFEKVFIIIMENTDVEEALKQPYLGKLVNDGAFFEDFHAVARPSQPNYIAMVGGSTLGVNSNDRYDLPYTSIVDLLEEKGKSWKVYAETYPGDCYKKMTYGKYARRHQPLMSFTRVSQQPARCAKFVNSQELAKDYASGTVPDYALYIPNNDNNGHDTNPAYADKWISGAFDKMFHDSVFLKDRLMVVTYDEGNPLQPANHIYTLFLGEMVKAGTKISRRYDFYDLLRTIEEAMGLGSLMRKDADASKITEAWRS